MLGGNAKQAFRKTSPISFEQPNMSVVNETEETANTPRAGAVGADRVRNLFEIADSLLDAISQEAEDSIRGATPLNASSQAICGVTANDTGLEDLPTLSLLESCLMDVHRAQQKSLNDRRLIQRNLMAKNYSFAELDKQRPSSRSTARPVSRSGGPLTGVTFGQTSRGGMVEEMDIKEEGEKKFGETYRAKFRETFALPDGVQDHEWGETAHLRDIPLERELRYKTKDELMQETALTAFQGGRFTLKNRIKKLVAGESREGDAENGKKDKPKKDAKPEEKTTPSEKVMIEWEKKKVEEHIASLRAKHQPKVTPPPVPPKGAQSSDKAGNKKVHFHEGAPRGSVDELVDFADEPKKSSSVFAKPEPPETLPMLPVEITDSKAREIYLQFQDEVRKWHQTVGVIHTNTTAQGKASQSFGDHLTNKYLCQLLDPLPSSEAVKGIRKTVAAEIEEIACCKDEQNKKPTGPEHLKLPGRRRSPGNVVPASLGNASTSLPQESAPGTPVTEGWDCSLCHKHNYPQNETCTVCQRRKGYKPLVNHTLIKRTTFKSQPQNNSSTSRLQTNSDDSLSNFIAEKDYEAKASDVELLSRDIRNVIDDIKIPGSTKLLGKQSASKF